MHNGNRPQRQATGCLGRESGRKGSGSSLQNRDDLVTSHFEKAKQGHLYVLANTEMCLIVKKNMLKTILHRDPGILGETCLSHHNS